ncbi:MAG: GAF domain-containing protein [Firmicutes bacterium]|nr:GAF domain-containing protein [Bacillota bacterium]MBQ7060000.1 GAF domain-containing protein [Bacillota bacterium]
MDYDLINAQLDALIHDEPHFLPNLCNASALLFDSLPDLNWAGFYLKILTDTSGKPNGKSELLLGPFQGKTACIRIPYGKGVCGTSAEQDKIQRVADVHLFPGHIACDSASASEIVIPLHARDGQVVGVLDLDSPVKDRFSPEDEEGLAVFARILEQHCDLHPLS